MTPVSPALDARQWRETLRSEACMLQNHPIHHTETVKRQLTVVFLVYSPFSTLPTKLSATKQHCYNNTQDKNQNQKLQPQTLPESCSRPDVHVSWLGCTGMQCCSAQAGLHHSHNNDGRGRPGAAAIEHPSISHRVGKPTEMEASGSAALLQRIFSPPLAIITLSRRQLLKPNQAP